MDYRLQNGTASQAQLGSGGGGFWNFGWLSNLFSGFDPSGWNFNLPQNSQSGGTTLQPYQIPTQSNSGSQLIKPEYIYIGIGLLAVYLIMKK